MPTKYSRTLVYPKFSCDLRKTFGEILANLIGKRGNILESDSLSLKQKLFLEVSSKLFINPEEFEVDVDGRPSSKKMKLERPAVGSSGLKKKDLEEGSEDEVGTTCCGFIGFEKEGSRRGVKN
ncbi:hypothetical protein Q3G72_018790 [Acer saccharum]|nr:hypothetical protein Q3G72_018790 [Acer saccharum]